jgi:ribosomal protein S27AE
MSQDGITEFPKIESQALYAAFDMIDEVRAEIPQAARGNKAARTRLRVKIMGVIHLLQLARRELPATTGKVKMEKYGVDESESAAKTASAVQTCPNCGSTVTAHGAVVLCPKCGSAPFEAPKADEKLPENNS